MNHESAAAILDVALQAALRDVQAVAAPERLETRYRKWRAMGSVGISDQ
jgi:acetyl-CoA carboxylase alpha subunit